MQIYYPDEEEAGDGQWWSGSVAADMLEPEEAQAAVQDCWSCEGLWERFVVHWAEPPVRPPPLSLQACHSTIPDVRGDEDSGLQAWGSTAAAEDLSSHRMSRIALRMPLSKAAW